jgi:hypothetical protein
LRRNYLKKAREDFQIGIFGKMKWGPIFWETAELENHVLFREEETISIYKHGPDAVKLFAAGQFYVLCMYICII